MSYISILPPNTTPMERALEATFAARLAALPVPVAQMMNPVTCPAAFLPWLAWSLSVDEWSPEWTEATQRAAIAASIGVHRRKGTVAALRAAIAAAGYGQVEVVERYALPRHDGSARHNGGDANYAKGARTPLDPLYWQDGVATGGVTAARAATGEAGGQAWAEYDLTGTMSGSGFSFGYISIAGSQLAGLAGQTWTASAILSVVSGNVGTGARVFLFDTATRAANTVTGAPMISTVTRILAADGNIRCGVQITGASGTVISGRVRIEGLQFEMAPARTELVYQPLIHGSPDHWAEYRLNIARPVTIAQAEQIRRIAAGVAPARCHLKEITYPAARHLHNGAIAHDGTFAHGAA